MWTATIRKRFNYVLENIVLFLPKYCKTGINYITKVNVLLMPLNSPELHEGYHCHKYWLKYLNKYKHLDCNVVKTISTVLSFFFSCNRCDKLWASRCIPSQLGVNFNLFISFCFYWFNTRKVSRIKLNKYISAMSKVTVILLHLFYFK